ncbi:uncharacterized protein LOC115625342 isoform X2 [Scaptodrosophila lebanonensis]|uniref:Uncharacterized protein LOC115625342 isoform X2 n=1 Tax=Drosophila lebanonensis TaxID=7225 RepID=A0A6J2TL43_DROLE|nr:uncharacterized protein LOC115625342 isoform X2 [Scaptodrosophila lebanonensis]
MFSSHPHLKRKTPAQGIDRKAFIGHLVDEYYTTTNVEAQEQVTANLANFAYDPINWTYLHEAQALEVFLELLETHNQSLQLHGIAALCNICLDRTAEQFIIEPKHTSIIIDLFLRTEHLEIVLHSIALFLQILSSDVQETLKYKELLVTPALLKRIQHWRQEAKDKRVLSHQAFSHLKQVQIIKRFTQKDLEQFAAFTGDYNYIHSKEVPVHERRVHGALLNAVVAGIIGTKLPGPGTVVLEQSFKFLHPCRIDVDTIVTVRLLNERKISVVEYDCRQNEQIVFAGKAKLLTQKH